MPQMTQKQWTEYQAIIKKCRALELESRSAKALQAQIAKLTERERTITENHTQLVAYLNMQLADFEKQVDAINLEVETHAPRPGAPKCAASNAGSIAR